MGLAIVTVTVMLVLLVPTMTWVRLRLPSMSRAVEFICLLPLTVPAIVLVVGLWPRLFVADRWLVYFLGASVGESTIWLGLAYVILVLPYSYGRSTRACGPSTCAPLGGGPVARGRLAHRHVARGPAEPAHRRAVGLVPVGGPRAR